MAKHTKKTVAAPHVSPTARHAKKPLSRPAPQNPAPVQRPVQQWLGRAFGLRSILVAGVVALGINLSVTQNSGYAWTRQHLESNWDFIRQHSNATPDERLQTKLGFDYGFLNFIRQNTPEDAVILFPLPEHVTEKSGNMQLTDNVTTKMWVTHFVYPRRILYKNEAETNPLYNEVTHVAVCASHGYEDLNYRVQQQPAFTVLSKTMK
ncbi:MAG: hypothetical protein LBT83_11040 [Tannerella sp.]|jgi:hypothetical protein|nr:hypothetical protein [Tannerella sp.]